MGEVGSYFQENSYLTPRACKWYWWVPPRLLTHLAAANHYHAAERMGEHMLKIDWPSYNKGIKVALNLISDRVLGTEKSRATKPYPEIEALAKEISNKKVARVPSGWKPRVNRDPSLNPLP